jgi:hypothetical protein
MSGVEGPDRPEPSAPGMPPAPVPPGAGYPPAPVGPPLGAPGHGVFDRRGGEQNGERARKALWFGLVAFALQAACSVVVLASLSDFYRELFDAIGSGRRLTTAQTTPPTSPAYLVASGVSQIASLVGLVVAILFLIWFHKALSNARALGLPLTRSPGWGVAGFFIPIVNLWFPYQSMRDLLPAGNAARPLVGRWWATYLGASFATSAAGLSALFSPVLAGVLVLVVVALYAVAAITLRELISASSQVAAELGGSVQPTNLGWGTPIDTTPGAPIGGNTVGGATNGATTGWVPPPVVPPKDPWNRT